MDKLEQLQVEIAKLQAEADAINEYRGSLTPAQHEAEKLHEVACHSNHDDRCGWFYEKWDGLGWTRQGYLKRVQEIQSMALTVDSALKVWKAVEGRS